MARLKRNETTMSKPGTVFGTDIRPNFESWMRHAFAHKFKTLHPDDEFAGFIVEPGTSYNPEDNNFEEVLVFSTIDNWGIYGRLLQNVRHKAMYALRNGCDSAEAGRNLHLVIEGDFPYDGFLKHRGIWAGGSGVRKEFDVVYTREIVDHYIELRSAVVREILDVVQWAREQGEDVGDWKFMAGTQEELEKLHQARREWVD